MKACLAYFQENETARKECCKGQLQSIARSLPWWAWLIIVVGVVVVLSCFIMCLCKLGYALIC